MNTPFYVSPAQLIKDRADFARQGIARGRSVALMTYDDGVAFLTENSSGALHKISEIYDRIGFAAVGKYNEFENLRVAGIRYADMRGYSYDRSDVSARALANAYAQTIGATFTTEAKPWEIEVALAQVGYHQSEDQIYRLSYDGSVSDEHHFVVMGGQAETLTERLREHWRVGMSRLEAFQLASQVLCGEGEERRQIPLDHWEGAYLDRHARRRTFHRLTAQELAGLVSTASDSGTGGESAADSGSAQSAHDSSEGQDGKDAEQNR